MREMSFSHDFPRVELPTPSGIVDQLVWLPQRAEGKRVLHLGCVDEHLTRERAGTGRLLHEQLARSAAELTGVDISEDGISVLAELVPGDYVVGDIERLGEMELPKVDLVIAAEVIEHLASPGLFLSGLGDYLRDSPATALITTPSAYSWRAVASFVGARRESVHPDHRVLYSPTTLARSIRLAGLEMTNLWVHTWRTGRGGIRAGVVDVVDRTALRWNPWLGVGLIAEVRVA